MGSTLRELYYDCISLSERAELKEKEYLKLREEDLERYKSFTASLEPWQSEKFHELMDNQLNILPMEHADMFAQGVQLGVKMTLEIFRSEIFEAQE